MRTNRTLILNNLMIFILFVSCSSPSDSTNESPTSDEAATYKQIKIIREPIRIIGEPVRIGGLEVAQNDFPKKMKNRILECGIIFQTSKYLQHLLRSLYKNFPNYA